ncbi:MAG: phytoene desaturase family protein [Candidatus Izemoplasmataceae bacterium]
MKKNVVIVGGGLGGMSAAIALAKYSSEYDITLIEKNAHLGGKLNVTTQEGFTFDLGPSIFTMPFIFDNLFKIHGKKREDYLDLEAVRPHWRTFFPDGKILDLEKNIQAMKEAPSNLTDADINDLKNYLAYGKMVYDFTDQTLFKNQSEKQLDTLKYYPPLKIIKDSDYFKTMDGGVNRFIKNPYLKDALNFFIKYVGSSPYDAPAVMNLLPYIQWEFDLWYVKGGMFNLSVGLEKLMRELGIKIITNVKVKSAIKQDKTITRLHLDNDESIDADLVVSNMEVIPFYEQITQEKSHHIEKIRKKYTPSCSGFALHLGLDKQYDQLRHHNVFFSEHPKKHFDTIFHQNRLPSDPTIYLVAPLKTDPSQGPKNHEIIKILPHIPHIPKDQPFTQEEYDAFKETILLKLERMGLKDLRKHIVTETLWTPETIQATYESTQGSIYGVVADKKKNMGFKNPKQSIFYDNLYFVGGSTNPGGGMPMVVLSGMQVVDQIRKETK